MRKSLFFLMIFTFILCSCSTKKPIPSENISFSSSSDIVSAESNDSIATASQTSTSTKAYYEDYYVSLLSDIPADNGDEISYVEALKIGDRIYSGSKNKLISFKEDLSDLQVIYEYPDANFYFGGLMQFDENTVCVRFADESSVYEALDPSDYAYLLFNLTDQSLTPFSSEKKEQFYPFKGLGDDYYINLKRIEDELYGFKRDLYKVNPNGEDQLLMADVGVVSIYKTGIFMIDYPEINNNNYSTVYFFNFKTQKLNKIMEMKNLWTFTVSGNYIIYSAGAYTQTYLYDIIHKTTVYLNEKLGFEFSSGSADIKNEHIFVSDYHKDTGEHEISDISMTDLRITEADKSNLPGYIGGWQYNIVVPEYGDTESEVPEKYDYTLWRHDWDYKNHFVY